MVIRATEQGLQKLEITPSNQAAEIGQNITVITITPKGNVPLDRDMGMSMKYKDRPMKTAPMMFEAELTQAIEDYESRAHVQSVVTEMDTVAGRMIPTVEVEIDGR